MGNRGCGVQGSRVPCSGSLLASGRCPEPRPPELAWTHGAGTVTRGGEPRANTPSSSPGKFKATHRNWQDDFGIASQVSNVAVQGHALLDGARLADGQGHSQDGVCTKFRWNRRVRLRSFSLTALLLPAFGPARRHGSRTAPLYRAYCPSPTRTHGSAVWIHLLSPQKRKPFLWAAEF